MGVLIIDNTGNVIEDSNSHGNGNKKPENFDKWGPSPMPDLQIVENTDLGKGNDIPPFLINPKFINENRKKADKTIGNN